MIPDTNLADTPGGPAYNDEGNVWRRSLYLLFASRGRSPRVIPTKVLRESSTRCSAPSWPRRSSWRPPAWLQQAARRSRAGARGLRTIAWHGHRHQQIPRTRACVDVPAIINAGATHDIGYDRAKYGFDCDTCGVLERHARPEPRHRAERRPW